MDLRRDHRDAREVISRVCDPEDAIGVREDPAGKSANPSKNFLKTLDRIETR